MSLLFGRRKGKKDDVGGSGSSSGGGCVETSSMAKSQEGPRDDQRMREKEKKKRNERRLDWEVVADRNSYSGSVAMPIVKDIQKSMNMLPRFAKRMMKASGLSKDQIDSNPTLILQCLVFLTRGQNWPSEVVEIQHVRSSSSMVTGSEVHDLFVRSVCIVLSFSFS